MSTNKFKKISVSENGILLSLKSKELKEISFSEIDKIYITVNNKKTNYVILLSVISLGIVILSLFYLPLGIVFLFPLSMVVIGIIISNNYQSYGLNIALKDGDVFKKRISQNLKYETIDVVNNIKEKIY
jgi:hypothetical protein|nr:hypothetical protein [uncultured Flavobacterium sp.]